MQNGNPYSSPLGDAVTDSDKLPKTFLWTWPQSVVIGILAAVAVTSGTMVFRQLLHPFLYYFGTYYFECVLVALAFGLAYRWPKCPVRTVLGLCFGSFALMFIVDQVMFGPRPAVPLLVWLPAMDALRNVALIRCVCWFLKLQPSRNSILPAVAAGTVAWLGLVLLGHYLTRWTEWNIDWFVAFNLDSSVITALQLRYVLGFAIPQSG